MSDPVLVSYGPQIHEAIDAERHRQEQLKAAGRFKYTCADVEMTDEERLAVLMEEIGEVARAVLERRLAYDTHGKDLRKELIQCAAVLVAWVQGLDAQPADKLASGIPPHEEVSDRAKLQPPRRQSRRELEEECDLLLEALENLRDEIDDILEGKEEEEEEPSDH